MLTIISSILVLVLVITNVVSDLVFPTSPCPLMFYYERNDIEGVYGVLKFKNDLSGFYKVELNMSLAAFTNQNIGIKRVTPIPAVQKGEDIVYKVTFPTANALPEILSVVFNNKVFCFASQGQGLLTGVTTLTAVDFLSTSGGFKEMFTKPQMVPIQMQPLYQQIVVPTQKPVPVNPPTTSPPTPTYPQTTKFPKTPGPEQPTTPFVDMTIISNRYTTEIFECGVADDTQPLLVHGKPTTEGEYPWLTALFHLQEEEYKFKCAGNLVSNKHVITAAHCVRMEKKVVVGKENIILVLGKHNIRSWAVRSVIRDVKGIYVHPDYNQPSDADIAVLLMSEIVEFTSKIKPICLWAEDGDVESIVGNNGTVVGWGRDEFDNVYIPEPRQLKLPVVSQEDCLRSDERFLKLTSHRTFCAGFVDVGSRKGEGPCTGDSGGGFIMRRRGKWTLRGIVSSALVDPDTHSCDVNNYMVFADISKFLPWISRLMAK